MTSEFGEIVENAGSAARELVGFAGAAKAMWDEPSLDTVLDGLSGAARAGSAVLKLKSAVSSNFGSSPVAIGGPPAALQVPKLGMGLMQGASSSLAAAAPALTVAGAGLGLINVGVGIYNAYQIKDMKRHLEGGFEKLQHQLEGGFGQIQRALQIQSTQLALLHAGLADLSCRIDVLRQEVHEGFAQIREDLQNIESRRRADEYRAGSPADVEDGMDDGYD